MAIGSRRRAAATGAVAALLTLAGCATGAEPPRPQHPEAWPPTNATECLRTRPVVEWTHHWPAALAVRDWRQPVRGGVVEVVLCGLVSGASSPPAAPMVLTLHGDGGVTVPPGAGVQWSGAESLVAPVTAEVSGPGSLTVLIPPPASPTGGPASPARRLSVFVVAEGQGLVVSECRDPQACRWGIG